MGLPERSQGGETCREMEAWRLDLEVIEHSSKSQSLHSSLHCNPWGALPGDYAQVTLIQGQQLDFEGRRQHIEVAKSLRDHHQQLDLGWQLCVQDSLYTKCSTTDRLKDAHHTCQPLSDVLIFRFHQALLSDNIL